MGKISWLVALLLLTGCGVATPRAAARPPAAATASLPGTRTSAATTAATPAATGSKAPAGASGAASPAATPAASRSPAAGTAPATASPHATASATVTATAAQGSVRLTPGRWAAAGTATGCASPLTSDLVAYAAADGAVTPGTGGTLAVYLHNNTNFCHAAGRTLNPAGAVWQLDVVPLGATTPAASVTLPAPTAALAPGAEVRLPLRVGAGLRPGWYLAVPLAAGGQAPPPASLPALQSIERFLVTAGPLRAGRVTVDAYPAPEVGGLSMPLVGVAWNAGDEATVTVHAALVCGPGTNRYASFGAVTATAAGPGFATDLPDLGGGQDPAIAQASWDVAFPGEATSLTLAARAQVRACGSGALLGSSGVAWRVNLPG